MIQNTTLLRAGCSGICRFNPSHSSIIDGIVKRTFHHTNFPYTGASLSFKPIPVSKKIDWTTYVGQTQNNLPHGEGSVEIPKEASYFGTFEYGVLFEGTIQYGNGDTYKGSLYNWIPDGQGVLVTQDQTRYKGTFLKGFLASGEISMPNGDVYTGEIEKNLPHGNGIYIFSDGTKYEGSFENGLGHGQGKLIKKDGTEYEGFFEDGKIYRGKIRYPDGILYHGSIRNNLPHGIGILKKGKTTIYSGKFCYGVPKQEKIIVASNFLSSRPDGPQWIIYPSRL